MKTKPRLWSHEIEALDHDVERLLVAAGALDVLGAHTEASKLREISRRIQSVTPRLKWDLEADHGRDLEADHGSESEKPALTQVTK